jgi:hypothetical protein
MLMPFASIQGKVRPPVFCGIEARPLAKFNTTSSTAIPSILAVIARESGRPSILKQDDVA